MHILVLGAGVIGITTAYALARRGCKVTVLDRGNSLAAGASFANGGQLSYSFVDPLASPQMVRALPGILMGRNPSARLKGGPSADLLRWGATFLRECTAARSRRNLERAVMLALESKSALLALQQRYAMSFRHRAAGKLVVTRSARALKSMEQKAALKRRWGQNIFALTREECFGLSPAFDAQLPDIAGGLYAPDDAVGDARRFTEALALVATANHGTEIKLKRHIRGLLIDRDQVVGVKTSAGDYSADAVVVCMGATAAPFLAPYGVRLPIMPVKGYSYTVSAGPLSPTLSLTDADNRLVYAPLGNQIRIAGLADFDGMDTAVDPARLEQLRTMSARVLPHAGDYDHACSGWAGQRPMTPDGLPIIGGTAIKNLFLNVGHGMFGWTFACGSADRLANALFGNTMPVGSKAA